MFKCDFIAFLFSSFIETLYVFIWVRLYMSEAKEIEEKKITVGVHFPTYFVSFDDEKKNGLISEEPMEVGKKNQNLILNSRNMTENCDEMNLPNVNLFLRLFWIVRFV